MSEKISLDSSDYMPLICPFFMGMGCGLPLPFVWIFGNVYPCLRNWLTPIIGTGI